MTKDSKFARQINNEDIYVKCFNCNKPVIMRCDPDNFEFNSTYTVLCDRCIEKENSEKIENKIIHVVQMVVNANKEMI